MFDATGLVVTPGLVDIHAHLYEHVTPLGVDPDATCLARGVTTAVDAGSAGASTLQGLIEYGIKPRRTRVLAFLHATLHGLASAGCSGGGVGGELDSLKQVSVEQAVAAAKAHPEVVVGFKVRLSADCAMDGAHEAEAYRRALEMSSATGLPLMVHHTFSTVPLGGLEGCPGGLRKGDIYTHTLHGFESNIMEPVDAAPAGEEGGKRPFSSPDWKIHPAVHEARRRGVIFDVGHGQGSFNWRMGEIAAAEGFWPDTISSDLHSGNKEGPLYDLPTAMTRFITLGRSLQEVIRAATATPAAAIGWEDRIGSLGIGREADVAVFRLEACDVMLEDCQSQRRRCTQRLVPAAVWRAGERVAVTQPARFPNEESIMSNRPSWDGLVVRDPEPPEDVPDHVKATHYLYSGEKKAKTGDANPVVWRRKEGEATLMCGPCGGGEDGGGVSTTAAFRRLREKASLYKCC